MLELTYTSNYFWTCFRKRFVIKTKLVTSILSIVTSLINFHCLHYYIPPGTGQLIALSRPFFMSVLNTNHRNNYWPNEGMRYVKCKHHFIFIHKSHKLRRKKQYFNLKSWQASHLQMIHGFLNHFQSWCSIRIKIEN